MTQLGPYHVHPGANVFPLIEGDEFDQLVADIKQNGLREPIVLNHDETILIDGRNRYRACEVAGADLVHRRLASHYTEEMLLDYIVGANVLRRHLNPGQLSLVTASFEPLYAAALKAAEAARKLLTASNQHTAKSSATEADLPQSPSVESRAEHAPPALASPDHSSRGPQARDLAAQRTGASPRGVQQAKAVQRDAPDLADKVRTGQMALDAADQERKRRVAAMPKPEPAPKPTAVMLTLRTHDGKEVAYPKPQSRATFNQTSGDGISWAEWSWNPVTGCLHGCNYCYAREIATNERYKGAYPAGFTPLFHRERLDAPANTTIPATHRDDPAWRRVFVCSMADLYGRWVPDEWITQVHQAMCSSPQWQYITLTKFPARYVGLEMPPGAWVGTSVDEQSRVRIAEDAFRKITGVGVKWLSLEPLREPLRFTDLSMFDWIVIGAQTETRQPDGVVPAFAPPFEWVAYLVAQAREAGCRIHLKPNLLGRTSPTSPGMQLLDEYPTPHQEDPRAEK